MGMLDLDNPGKPAVMSCDAVSNGVMSSESGIVFVFTVRSSSLNLLSPFTILQVQVGLAQMQ